MVPHEVVRTFEVFQSNVIAAQRVAYQAHVLVHVRRQRVVIAKDTPADKQRFVVVQKRLRMQRIDVNKRVKLVHSIL